MGTTKERGKYQGVSLPEDLILEIKKFVLDNPKYRSIAEYTKQALREKMDRDLTKEYGTLSGKTPVDIKLEELEKKVDQLIKELKKKK